MLPAIGFDDQSRSEMHEIDDVGTDRLLTAELLAIQSVCTQMFPEPMFGIGHLPAEQLRERA